MPKRKRPAKIPTPAWQPSYTGLRGLSRSLGGKALLAGAIVGLVVLAAVVIIFAFLRDYLEERGRPGSAAVTVGETTFDLDYFARRLRLFVLQSGGPGSQLAQPSVATQFVSASLVSEEIARTFALELEVSASETEVEDELAARLGLAKEDPNFQTAYEQELQRTDFSDEEYRQMVGAQLLADRVREKLGADVAAELEQVHYRQIQVSSQQEADAIVARLNAGEDFATLASELSLDDSTKANGGDAGWLARGQGGQELEDTLFALEPGGPSGSFLLGDRFLVLQVIEKQVRTLDDTQREQIIDQNYSKWVAEKEEQSKVVNHVLDDPDKLGWALDEAYGS